MIPLAVLKLIEQLFIVINHYFNAGCNWMIPLAVLKLQCAVIHCHSEASFKLQLDDTACGIETLNFPSKTEESE